MVPKPPEEGIQELSCLGKQGPGLVETKLSAASVCEKPLGPGGSTRGSCQPKNSQ